MPELPEVEVVKQSLDKKIKEKKVKKVLVRNRNLRKKVPLNFENFFINQKITKIGRFSKYLILYFSNNKICLIHLGMSGTIHFLKINKKTVRTNTSFYKSPKLPSKHNHIEIFFNNCKIIYNDPRRFGFFEIVKNEKLLKKKFSHLGPEPFNSKYTLDYFHLKLRGKEKNIKNFLIDQNFISGIGNIYASEILYLCKINPFEKAKNLKKNDLKKILINSKKVLLEAINKGGSSIKDFKNISGKDGGFQSEFKVYQREGLKCKRTNCAGTINKKNISNRSTFFCNSCQK
ncbi:bifunctional DNA-formamidopyrimidine glycosylase/DNA-(apurinic or apyrimidinic site) lyase [Candidatus Pelagibacter sp.]|nr:bifunctional DNA-formamidopyrimidine glycosylase/DNA-(apurinic or apyrimidinic site) lyase [Candidatus Pelagibacter sp.]